MPAARPGGGGRRREGAVYFFDDTFDGLLTAVFDAYARRSFPGTLLAEGAPGPLFADDMHHVVTDAAKASRVWRALGRKLSAFAHRCVAQCWLADEQDTPMVLFRYICRVVDAPGRVETNFADPAVLDFVRMWKRVDWERTRLMQFVRFQKAADGTYFAPVEPQKDALPLVVPHFRDRFADQRWLLYDVGRQYGFCYDLRQVHRVSFAEGVPAGLHGGRLDDSLLAEDELLFQRLWQTYFRAICIRERLNPRKHRQDMPVRYWKYLTEKQGPG